MICNKCGTDNADQSAVCGNCGKSLSSDTGSPKIGTSPIRSIGTRKKVMIYSAILAVVILAAAIIFISVNNSHTRIVDASMTSQINKGTGAPIVKADVFTVSTPVIYVTFRIINVSPGTKVAAVWSDENSEPLSLSEIVTVNADARVVFEFAANGSFFAGKYKVTLMINNVEKKTLGFEIK
jgi:hypothetical protein